MNHVRLLDCTLRDGAYLVDKKFGEQTIRGITTGLIKAGIDYIEIGFFQNGDYGEGKTVYKNSEDAKRYIPKDKGKSRFTVLADYSRYSISNLDERTEDGIDAVRECFFKEERYDALDACRVIKEKGYQLFIQPVDILGYSDTELIEFLHMVNSIEPYCLSIVDTFGSMYQEDLKRVFEIVHYHLISSCKIGFHSHNNMQMSSALSQEFVRMTLGKREIIIDGTMSGMGRGAGNTPTELIAQYLVAKQGYNYDIDELLDIIDVYMDNLRSRCSWGYGTNYFVAGCYGAHVNNVAYLGTKNSIRSRDIRYILNKIGTEKRKRYDYDLLEKSYIDMMNEDVDDNKDREILAKKIGETPVLILAPGSSIDENIEKIQNYISINKPFIISINFIHNSIKSDYVYMSNLRRYQIYSDNEAFKCANKIMTSNLPQEAFDNKTIVLSFVKLTKCGWDSMDNSTLMLLRLLSDLKIKNIAIAGFDGYSTDYKGKNYVQKNLELNSSYENATHLNQEIKEMLVDFDKAKRQSDMIIEFLTPSRFEECLCKQEK